MKILRNIIEIDEEKCDGCGLCVPSCAEGAIRIVDGKARLAAEKYCDGLGACLGECPRGAIRMVEKEVEAFDEAAAMEHLRSPKGGAGPAPAVRPSGCPSARLHRFKGGSAEPCCVSPTGVAAVTSALTHWPVQIRLVPPMPPS